MFYRLDETTYINTNHIVKLIRTNKAYTRQGEPFEEPYLKYLYSLTLSNGEEITLADEVGRAMLEAIGVHNPLR